MVTLHKSAELDSDYVVSISFAERGAARSLLGLSRDEKVET